MNYRYRLLLRMRPVLRFVKYRILHVEDAPQRLARGIAVGLFTGFLPLFGLQMIAAFAIARVIRANQIMALLFTWISNPFTFIVIFYPGYRFGRFLFNFFERKPELDAEEVEELLETAFHVENVFVDIFSSEFWNRVLFAIKQVGFETLVGGLVLGTIAAAIGYWLSLAGIQRYRRRKFRSLRRLHQKLHNAQSPSMAPES